MKTFEITVSINAHFAWWVYPYIGAVNTFARLTGLSPDVDKCVAFALRGVKIKLGDPQ